MRREKEKKKQREKNEVNERLVDVEEKGRAEGEMGQRLDELGRSKEGMQLLYFTLCLCRSAVSCVLY